MRKVIGVLLIAIAVGIVFGVCVLATIANGGTFVQAIAVFCLAVAVTLVIMALVGVAVYYLFP